MNGFQVKPGEIRKAAEAVGRNSDHLGEMSAYCESLRSSADGTEFGDTFSDLQKNYDKVVDTQVEVLDDLQEKLRLTRDALDSAADAYSINDSSAGDHFGETEEAPVPSGPEPVPNSAEES